MKVFKLIIDPQPAPRPRIRTMMVNGKRINATYYPNDYTKYKHTLKLLILEQNPEIKDYGFIIAEVASPYKKGTPKKQLIDKAPMRGKYDCDNVIKPLLDALEDAGILKNDSQIHTQAIRKVWTTGRGYIKFAMK